MGPIARDIARHFIQRWNFLKSTKSMHRRSLPFLMPKGEYVAARDESDFSGTCRVQLLRSSSRWSSDIEREVSLIHEFFFFFVFIFMLYSIQFIMRTWSVFRMLNIIFISKINSLVK